ATLKYLCIGAERLTLDLVKRCRGLISKDCRVFNMYGPTEATIISAVLEIDMPDVERYRILSSIPIGRPVANAPLFVLDNHLNICPVNVTGELYISGDGVSLGYLNDQLKTSRSFIENPFKPGTAGSVKRDYFYKTGDMVRWLSNGEIEFTGRIDQQVKIRGFRIELTEIESQLLKHPAVKEAVVIDRKDDGEKYLCAYVVPGGAAPAGHPYSGALCIEHGEAKEFLSQTLPDYMIPAFFIPIEKIPLTPNGKIDKEELPEPHFQLESVQYVSPRDEIEEKLVKIWSGVLEVDEVHIGIDSNFFDLGGHSLKAAPLVARIHKAFNIKVPLAELFVSGCIRKLAQYIKGTAEDTYVPIGSVEEREYYELSHSQKRIWVQSQIEEASLSFNIKAAFRAGGELNRAAFENVFKTLIQRHESLRTIFISVNDQPMQKILAPGERGFTLEFIDLRTAEGSESEAWQHIKSESDTPFDLTGGPLFRAKFLQLEENAYIFIFTMHHIVSDGTSMEVLSREVLPLYDSYCRGKENPLSPLPIQYKDYAAWQNRCLQRGEMEAHETYWLHQLSGELPILELPFDKERPPMMTYRGDIVQLHLEQELTRALKTLARQNDGTLFMTFAAVVKVLLCRYANQEDIIIGTPIAGREHADLEGQVGFYLNTVALRTRVEYEETFTDLLKRVKVITLDAYKHQVYPFDRLVERLGIQRDISRHPIFDVMVDMISFDAFENIPHGSLTMTPIESGYNKSKFDLTIYIIEREDTIDIKFEYYADLFERETITHMSDCFSELLKSIIESPLSSIADLQFEEEPDLGIISAINRA
ncbi:MAG: AMP-binding protein, partial [bacterium]|nr:AMP-binding protein [bacterium]